MLETRGRVDETRPPLIKGRKKECGGFTKKNIQFNNTFDWIFHVRETRPPALPPPAASRRASLTFPSASLAEARRWASIRQTGSLARTLFRINVIHCQRSRLHCTLDVSPFVRGAPEQCSVILAEANMIKALRQ